MPSPVDAQDWTLQDPWVATDPTAATDGFDLGAGKFASNGKRPSGYLVQFFRKVSDATITDLRVHVYARGVWAVVLAPGTDGVIFSSISLTTARPAVQFRLGAAVDDRVAFTGTPSEDVGVAIAPEWD